MKVYTVEDLNTFERDKYGRLICPSGDYTQIKSFVKDKHQDNAQWLTEYTEAIRYAKIVLQGASK